MVDLTRVKTHLSEDLMLAMDDIISRLFPYNPSLRPTSFLESVYKIRTERALARVGNNPNERTIEDALNYVGESNLVTPVRGYLERQIGDNQKKLSDYIEQLTQLDELKKQNGKLRGWQRSNVMGLEQEINRHSELQTCYEYLLETLNSKGPNAFVVEQERLKPTMFPYAVH